MFWALDKRLTETVPQRNQNTCIRHHFDKHMFWALKKRLTETETALWSTLNTCFRHALVFWRSGKTYGFVLGTFKDVP